MTNPNENEKKKTTQYLAERSPLLKTIFFIVTVILTAAGTFIMSASMMSDYWEYMTWNKQRVLEIAYERKHHRNRVNVESLPNDPVIKLTIHHDGNVNTIYLLPMHGGIWTLCVSLTEEQLSISKNIDIPAKTCFNYLWAEFESELQPDWNSRFHNVSISCALVCLILLTSAAIVGIFGVFKHQLSAILVTGVMYLLAGVFASFTIMIIHFKNIDCKRNHYDLYNSMKLTADNKTELMDNGIVHQHEGEDISHIWKPYYMAREYHVGWSFDYGVVGVAIATITSLLWIVFSKVQRYTPPLTHL